jgi:hypothetical protein
LLSLIVFDPLRLYHSPQHMLVFYYVHLLSGPQGIKRHVVSPTTNDNEHGGIADARFWRKAVVHTQQHRVTDKE